MSSVVSILTELVPDIPEVIALIQAIEAGIVAEKAAVSIHDKVKALEPAIEAAAALADLVKGQVSPPAKPSA